MVSKVKEPNWLQCDVPLMTCFGYITPKSTLLVLREHYYGKNIERKIYRRLNAIRSLVHSRPFAGRGISCSDFFVFYCFLISCFVHKNMNTLTWDLHYSSKCVILPVLSISVNYSFHTNVTYDLLAFSRRYVYIVIC